MPLHVPKNLLLLFIYQFSSQDYNNVLVQGSLHFYFQLLLCKVLKCAVCVCTSQPKVIAIILFLFSQSHALLSVLAERYYPIGRAGTFRQGESLSSHQYLY